MKIKVYYMLGNNTVYLYVINRQYLNKTEVKYISKHTDFFIQKVLGAGKNV
jgi:hypothetical protein